MKRMPFEDLFGQRFGDLIAIRSFIKTKRRWWTCACKCGRTKAVQANHLKSGVVRSCGCLHARSIGERSRLHGMSGTRIFQNWAAMRQRCQNPKNRAYPSYGGRGIIVCERWQKFEHFLADMGEPPPGMQLERLDNDGPYSPENCKWAGFDVQANNRRSSRRLTFNGETKTVAQWSLLTGIDRGTLVERLNRGWSSERALNPQKFSKGGRPRIIS